MELDLIKLNNGLLKEIKINQTVVIPKDLYKSSTIVELKNLLLEGLVYKDSADIINLQAKLSGVMVLEDSISLELIEYEFSCEIDEELEETLEKLENTLDITDILWQNIMLEVPLKLSYVENFNDYQGDGWKLVSEESITNTNTNNPFKELKDMMGEE